MVNLGFDTKVSRPNCSSHNGTDHDPPAGKTTYNPEQQVTNNKSKEESSGNPVQYRD